MNKVMAWVLGMTKLGKIVLPIQKFLSGKKVYLAAGAVGIPALINILLNFSDQGLDYAVGLTTKPEYKALMEAIAGAALRSAVTKAANPAKDPNVGEATNQ